MLWPVLFIIVGIISLILAISGDISPVKAGPTSPMQNTEVVFVQLETDDFFLFSTFERVFAYAPGNLYALDLSNPGKPPRALTNFEDATVMAPEVSYDGTRIIFAMKFGETGYFHIYEINQDGSGLRQITTGEYNDIDPAYLPNGRLIFTSDRPGTLDEYDQAPTQALYTINSDGSGIKQLSFHPNADQMATVASNGQIVWSFWAKLGPMNRFSIWKANPDGTEPFSVWGPHPEDLETILEDEVVLFEPRELPDGRFLTVATSRFDNYAAGPLFVVDPEFISSQPYQVTPDIPAEPLPSPAGRIKSAVPVDIGDGTQDWVIVSYSSGPVYQIGLNGSDFVEPPDFGLYLMNLNLGLSSLQPIFDDSGLQELDPVILNQRPTPPIIESKLNTNAENTGVLIIEDVFARMDERQPNPEPGTLAFFRVLAQTSRYPDDQVITVTEHDVPKIVLGEVPVLQDGSVAVEVPASVGLFWQTLDQDRVMTVTERFYEYVQSGETRRCGGCHFEPNHNQPMPSVDPLALNVEPVKLSLNDGNIVTFYDDVRPILDAKCVSCHAGAAPAAGLNLADDRLHQTTVAFNNLLRFHNKEEYFNYVGRDAPAYETPLYGVLSGNEYYGAPDWRHHEPSALHAELLSNDEFVEIMTWIDTGLTFYYATGNQTRLPVASPDRTMFDHEIYPLLEGMDCAGCHSNGDFFELEEVTLDYFGFANIPADFEQEEREYFLMELHRSVTGWGNYTNPDQSELLTRLLPGGTHTGGAFFSGPDDPNYQKILAWYETGRIASAPPASECLSDANVNDRVDVNDMMSTLLKSNCVSYLPMLASSWHQPWPPSFGPN